MTPDVHDGVIGREPDLAVFDGFLADLAAGRGRCVLVEGEPGIGKWALLGAVRAAAGRTGLDVSYGGCDELRQRFPLSVLLDALKIEASSPDRRRARAAEVGPETAGPVLARGWSVSLVAGDPVMAAVERLLVLVDRLCAAGPLVLAVDDLQWADDASLLVWRQLCRATKQLPLLLVGTCRPVPRRPDLLRLRRDLQARYGTVLRLERLSPGTVAELVLRVTGGRPGPELSDRLELGSGNPLDVRGILYPLDRAKALGA